jgi:hypothetical protein
VIVNNTPAAPSLQVVALPANFGGLVSLQIRPNMPGVLTTLAATISVDLSLKN